MQHPMLMVAPLVALSVILCLRQVRESWLGWPVRIELWFLITVLVRDYAGVYLMHLATSTASPYWRIVIARSSVTAEAAAPALLLLGAIVLLEAGVVRRATVFLAASATLGSGMLTAWRAVAPLMAYYPRYPILTLIAVVDPYSQAGFYLAFFAALLAVKKARDAPATGPSWQRSSSNLHGNSDWMPISAARRRFQAGGIIIGEAYRPDLTPRSEARHRCCAMTARLARDIVSSSPAQAATKPPGSASRVRWSGATRSSTSIRRPRSSRWFARRAKPWAIA